MTVNKNQAVIDYLRTCPYVRDNPLYFNFLTAADKANQLVTDPNDTASDRHFVDGSVLTHTQFTFVSDLTISDDEIIVDPETGTATLANENIEDVELIQQLIDWIGEQNDAENYPNFGEKCLVQNISTLTTNPVFDGINTSVSAALAIYSVAIRIEYIDYNKVIWS